MQDVDPLVNAAETYERPAYSYATEGKYNGFNPFFAGNMDAPGKGADWNWLSLYFSTTQSSLQSGNVVTSSKFTGATIYTLYLPNMVQGSVLFAGSGGLVTQDNNNFYFDDTNNRLGIGNNTPSVALDVNGDIRDRSMTLGSVLFAGSTGIVSQDNSNFFWDHTNLCETITGTVGKQLRLAYDVTHFTDLQTDSSGSFKITPNGGNGTVKIVTTSAFAELYIDGIAAGQSNVYFSHGGFIEWTIGRQATSQALEFDSNGMSGAIVLLNATGYMGLQHFTPRRRLDILETAAPQFRLTYADNTVYTDFQTDSSGNLTVTPTGGQLLLGTGTAANPSLAQSAHPSSGMYWSAAGRTIFSVLGNANVSIGSASALLITNTGNLGFSSSDATGAADVSLFRDAANSLGLRNGLNAQTLSVYNTYTAGTPDYERVELAWVGNKAFLRTATSGTGSARVLGIKGGFSSVTAMDFGANAAPVINIGGNYSLLNAAGGTYLQITANNSQHTSGNMIQLSLIGTNADAGLNSTGALMPISITPTINYTGAARTGKVYLQYLAPTLTSLPTGNNAGIAFSSAFTNSSFPAMRFWNTADEVTDYEAFEASWGLITANVFGLRTNKGGAGTSRSLIVYYGSTNVPAITVPGNTASVVDIAAIASTGSAASGAARVRIHSTSVTATSGTDTALQLPTSWSPTSTSTMIGRCLSLSPTVNYSAGTPGAGKVNLLYMAPTLTAQPTGNNGGLVFSSAFTSSTFPEYLSYNTADEDTNWERFEKGWHITANRYTMRVTKGGTGTVRSLAIAYGAVTTSALLVPDAFANTIELAVGGSTAGNNATGRVRVSNALSLTATSGSHLEVNVVPAYAPTSTSTLAATVLKLAPTINYSAGTPGAGYIYGLYLAPVNTALPTGISAAIALSSTASGINGIVWNNQTDEQTNYENVKAFYTGNIWTLISAAGGTGTVRDMKFDPGTGDIIWGKALVALGGGAAATLGTIGGGGPAAAAQNTWMRIKDSAGNAFWVPAWK